MREKGMFVGRAKELGELNEWLKSEKTCIAVTGKGGIGKTALVREFARTSKDKSIYTSLKGESEAVQPIKIVLERIEKGLGRKIAKWFEKRWREELKEVDVHGEVKFPGGFGAGLGFGVKKEVKEEAKKGLKQILWELDLRLKRRTVIIVDDLQLTDNESLRLVCEIANVNWENLRWILIHREKEEIKENGLKDLSGWSLLDVKGMNDDDISALFLKHAEEKLVIRRIDKKAFHGVMNGYPNFIETIVSALKEKYGEAEIEITEDFIRENYDTFAKPTEFVIDNYLDEDEKLNLLSIAILKEDARVEGLVSSHILTTEILKVFSKFLGARLRYKKLKDFGFIEVERGEIEIHDAKRDWIVDVMDQKDERKVKGVREHVMKYFLMASNAAKKGDYITAASTNLFAYHHASHIDHELAIERLVMASAGFQDYGDDFSAYICSCQALEEISVMASNHSLMLLKLGALMIKSNALFKRGLCRYYVFNLEEIIEEIIRDATETFFILKEADEEKREGSLKWYYIEIASGIMNYYANEGKADAILDFLKNTPLEEEQKAKLKIRASMMLTLLWDERSKKLLEDVEEKEVEDEDKCWILYIKGYWSMDDFERASVLFEECARCFEPDHEAVREYCLAAVLTSDGMRALKMLANAKRILRIRDVASTLCYKFADAIVSGRKEKARKFYNGLSGAKMGGGQMMRYWWHYFQAFALLDCLDGLSLREDVKKVIEPYLLYRITSSLNSREEALRVLEEAEVQPNYKNILRNIISGGDKDKMARFIGFWFLTSVS